MNFLYLQHAPGVKPQTVRDEEAQALRRKQDEQIAKWRKQRPRFLARWFAGHPDLMT